MCLNNYDMQLICRVDEFTVKNVGLIPELENIEKKQVHQSCTENCREWVSESLEFHS